MNYNILWLHVEFQILGVIIVSSLIDVVLVALLSLPVAYLWHVQLPLEVLGDDSPQEAEELHSGDWGVTQGERAGWGLVRRGSS